MRPPISVGWSASPAAGRALSLMHPYAVMGTRAAHDAPARCGVPMLSGTHVPLEGTGQGRHRGGCVLVNRVSVPKDRFRKRERGQLLDAPIGLRHVRSVLGIRAT